MSLLKNLTSDESINNEKDSVGGFSVMDSAIYPSKVALAYLNVATSGAMGLVVNFKTEDDKEIRQTLWMTSGKEKGCLNYYVDGKGEKHYLPGFNIANSLCLLTVGKEVSAMETEEKTIKVYNSEAKAEVPTKVQMLTELLDKDILVGLLKVIEDKTVKNPTTNIYEPTGETREVNEVDKLFRARDKMTTAEIRAKATEPAFYETWDKKWTGQVRNKAKGTAGAGTAGAPKGAGAKPAGAGGKPTASLFE